MKVPGSDYLEVIPLSEPNERFPLDNKILSTLTFYKNEQVEVLFKGVLSEGCEISYLGKSLLLEDKKTWETKIKVKGDPKAITFEFTDARGNKSEIRFFLAWKNNPPSFHLKIKEAGETRAKSYSQGVDSDFVIAPFVQLYRLGTPVEAITLSEGNSPSLNFRIFYPSQTAQAPMMWTFKIFDASSKVVFKQEGNEAFPSSFAWPDLKRILVAGEEYTYQLSGMSDSQAFLSPELKFAVEKNPPSKWTVTPSARFSILRLKAVDDNNEKAGATLPSGLSPGIGLRVDRMWGNRFRSSVEFKLDKYGFTEPRSGLSIGEPTYFSAMMGGGIVGNDVSFEVLLGLQSELILRSVGTTLGFDTILLPRIQSSLAYRFLESENYDLNMEFGLGYEMGSAQPVYSTYSVFDAYGKLRLTYPLAKTTLTPAFSISQKKLPTSIVTENFTLFLFEFAVSFFP